MLKARVEAETDVRKFATWFGRDSALLGHVHVPTGETCRGGVVLCPPIGHEYIRSYRALMLVAQELCVRGFLVLRFDYACTGDSLGDQGSPDAVERWMSSIREAVGFVRASQSGPVVLGGIRLGALLAADLADELDVAALVLWDPEISGTAYLRRQRALYRMYVNADDNPVPVVGAELNAAVVPYLKAMDLLGTAERCPERRFPTLLAVRKGESATKLGVQRAWSADILEVSGQADFLDSSAFEITMPTESPSDIANWVAGHMPGSLHRVAIRRQDRTIAGHTIGGRPIVESLEYSGPNRLFTIRTVVGSRDEVPRSSPLVFFSGAGEHRCGPARLWVELARSATDVGATSARIDRRGTGESGDVVPGECIPLFSRASRQDAVQVMDEFTAGPRPTLAGMCSGGWHAAFGAATRSAEEVIVLNTSGWDVNRRRIGWIVRIARWGRHPYSASYENKLFDGLIGFNERLLARVPYWLWRVMGLFRIAHVPFFEVLARRSGRGVKVTIATVDEDWDSFVSTRGLRGIRKLRSRGFEVDTVHFVGDHSLFSPGARAGVKKLFRDRDRRNHLDDLVG